jgi:YVTN family beta-propeller protein
VRFRSQPGRSAAGARSFHGIAGAVVAIALAAGGSVVGAATAQVAPGPSPGVIATIDVGGNPTADAFDPVNDNLYVANASGGTVSVIDESGDAGTGKVTATIKVGNYPIAVAVDPSNGNVYVANFYGDTVSVIDAGTGKVSATLPLGGPPGALAVDPANHNVYVSDSNLGTVSVIDESGDAGTGRITTLDLRANDYEALAVDPSTHQLYVALSDGSGSDGAVLVVDESGAAGTATLTATIPVGAGAVGLAVDSSNHNVYVTDVFDDAVSVIDESGDGRRGTVTATIPLGGEAGGLAVDPSTHDVYVTNIDGVLSVIDESGDARGGTVTAQIADGMGGDMAVDPSTHRVYVADYLTGTVLVVGPAGTPVAPTITGTPMAATAGVAFSYPFVATGIPTPVESVTGGELPPGLTVSPTGELSGTSDTGGTYGFRLTATNSLGRASEYVVMKVIAVADVALSVTAPATVDDGATFTETVTVTNHGPSPAAGVATDLLINNGLFVATAPGATVDSGDLVWNDAALAAGTSVTHTATFIVHQNVHASTHIGGVTESAVDDPDLANNAAIEAIRFG